VNCENLKSLGDFGGKEIEGGRVVGANRKERGIYGKVVISLTRK
jgi:hypothetical protein